MISPSGFPGLDAAFKITQFPSLTVMVNSTDPLWFHSRGLGYEKVPFLFFLTPSRHFSYHACSSCQNGMVFAVNPTVDETYDVFRAMARSSSPDGAPASVAGGPPSASSAASSSSPTSSNNNGALAVGARAGSLLAIVGFVTSILLYASFNYFRVGLKYDLQHVSTSLCIAFFFFRCFNDGRHYWIVFQSNFSGLIF
jgi:hypothetical protein